MGVHMLTRSRIYMFISKEGISHLAAARAAALLNLLLREQTQARRHALRRQQIDLRGVVCT